LAVEDGHDGVRWVSEWDAHVSAPFRMK
jgi:hypothetical protein